MVGSVDSRVSLGLDGSPIKGMYVESSKSARKSHHSILVSGEGLPVVEEFHLLAAFDRGVK